MANSLASNASHSSLGSANKINNLYQISLIGAALGYQGDPVPRHARSFFERDPVPFEEAP